MRKENKEVLIKALEKLPIWLLEMKVSKQNRDLIGLKSQGILSDNHKWRKVCYKRNIIRGILFDKLKKLDKGELRENNPTYSDYITYGEHKKLDELKKEQEKK